MIRTEAERIKASHQMVAAGTTVLTLGTAAIVIRFASRRISRSKIWWDDWLAVSGLCGLIAFCGIIYGNFPKHWDLNAIPLSGKREQTSARSAYAAILVYFFIQVCLKCSILAFYWRLFSFSIIKIPLILTFVVVILWFITAVFVAIFQCMPIYAAWKETNSAYKCIQLNPFFFGSSIPNILTDLGLIILPLPCLYRLRIPRAQKCVLIGFFAFSGFVLFASAFRLYYLVNLDEKDYKQNWTIHDAVLWSVVEHGVGVICVCLAPSKPFFATIPCIASAFARVENGPVDTPSFSWWSPVSRDARHASGNAITQVSTTITVSSQLSSTD